MKKRIPATISRLNRKRGEKGKIEVVPSLLPLSAIKKIYENSVERCHFRDEMCWMLESGKSQRIFTFSCGLEDIFTHYYAGNIVRFPVINGYTTMAA